jgi:S-adenosylmethionine:tRNA ribosyltransferase-isomerase
MNIEEFDFHLPEDRIALRPHEPKDHAKMLVVRKDSLVHQYVYDLPSLLTEKDILVFNDTKVLPAQLYGTLNSLEGRAVECNLHKRISPISWLAFAKKTKRMKMGDVIFFGQGLLKAQIKAIQSEDGIGELELLFDCKIGELEGLIAQIGLMPLPPYIASKRDIDEKDSKDYQTIFAKKEGAVAAPTASLHYTDSLLQDLAQKNIQTARITLHVGAGTFLPVKVQDTKDHKMHAEYGEINLETAAKINQVKLHGGRVIAVGTTVLRLLESAADENGLLKEFYSDTDIFISPGYRFKIVDVLQTNFHLPKSTLFMLVSAFMGLDTMRKAYQTAIDQNYRFYSYGDSSLLFRD